MRRIALLLLFFLCPGAWAEVVVDTPWVRPTPPRAKLAAGYMTILNHSGTPDRLLGARSPLAERVEMHVHIHEGHVVRMRRVAEFRIPANARFVLLPGGAHLMFVNIKQRFLEGAKVPVTLKFENAGEVRIDFRVGQP